MEELGFPGYEATAWFGLMGPAGTPKPIIDKIYDETVKLLAQPDVRGKLESAGPSARRQHAGTVPRTWSNNGNADVGQGHPERRHQTGAIAPGNGWEDGNLIRAGLAALAVLLVAAPATAQGQYPDKPVRFIVGFTGRAAQPTSRRGCSRRNSRRRGMLR